MIQMTIFTKNHKNCLATEGKAPTVILVCPPRRKDIFQVKKFIAWFKPPFSIIVVARLKTFPPYENPGCVIVALYIRYFEYTTRFS